jgi:hypothetical protein
MALSRRQKSRLLPPEAKALSANGAEQAARVAPFAAGNEGVVRKSAAGEFCQLN